MGWSQAYHYHLDKDISIIEAMKLRNGNDPRAGDLHCHKECFAKKIGSKLLTRQESSDGRRAHFARWPRNYTKGDTSCPTRTIAISKRESMDYARYYSDFEAFLNELSPASNPYYIEKVKKGRRGLLLPDFIITHSKNNPHGITETDIHIVDENKRRKKRFLKTTLDGNVAEIVIRISEYTLEQLSDFQRGGVERMQAEWDYIMRLLQKQKLAKEREEERLKVLEQNRRRLEHDLAMMKKLGVNTRQEMLAKIEKNRRDAEEREKAAKEAAKREKELELWLEKCKHREKALAPVYDAFRQHMMPILEAGKVVGLPSSWYWWYYLWENHEERIQIKLIEWRMGLISDDEFWDYDWFYFDNPSKQLSKGDYSSMADLIEKMLAQAEEINRNPPKIGDAPKSAIRNIENVPIEERFHLICFTPFSYWADTKIAHIVRKKHSNSNDS